MLFNNNAYQSLHLKRTKSIGELWVDRGIECGLMILFLRSKLGLQLDLMISGKKKREI